MKNHIYIAVQLQKESANLLPAALARLAQNLAENKMGQFLFINIFRHAFPEIPLQILINASRWCGVCEQGLSDDAFNELLQPWIK